jgi:hypothetical protein
MRWIALIAAAAALMTGPAFAAGYGEFTGNWRNDDAGTRDITRVRITGGGGGLNVRVWGQCHPTDCDWGTVNALGYSYSPAANPATNATDLMATFNQGFAQTILILTDRPGDRLSYAIFTRFTDGSGRRPYVARGTLRKQAGGWPGWPPVPFPPGPGPFPPGPGPGDDGGPTTYKTGPLSIPQTYLADLDEGVVINNSTADLWFEAVNPSEMYLVPRNGARFWLGDGSNRGYEGCSSGGSYSTARIALEDVPVGTYVCVRTNGGRYSQFRVNSITGYPKLLKIGYTTWE